MLQLHDKKFQIYITFEQINQSLKTMGEALSRDLEGETPLFIAVLNGSFMVAADLLKHYSGPCEISFVKMASYQGTQSSETIHELIGLNHDLSGRHVVVIEDIVDTGNTVVALHRLFADKGLKSLRFASLFLKPDAYKKDVPINYVGINIPDKFIVGYGLDYDGLGRNLKDVYQLAE